LQKSYQTEPKPRPKTRTRPTMRTLSPPTNDWNEVDLNKQALREDCISCVRWCVRRGLRRDLEVCAQDGDERTLKVRADKRVPHWRCGTCKTTISAYHGTIFEGSHLAIGTLLTIMYSFARGYSYQETKGACMQTEGKNSRITRSVDGDRSSTVLSRLFI